MRKTAPLMAFAALTLLISSHTANAPEAKKQEPFKFVSVAQSPIINVSKVSYTYSNKSIEKVEEKSKNKRPEYKILGKIEPLMLDYIYEQCESHGVSYETVMSIAKVESDFDLYEVSSTHDYGILQINIRNKKWLSEREHMDSVDIQNPKHNIRLSLSYLSYLQEYWSGLGYGDEDVYKLSIVSYHLGPTQTREYMKHHSLDDNTYLQKVRLAKKMIETGEGETN